MRRMQSGYPRFAAPRNSERESAMVEITKSHLSMRRRLRALMVLLGCMITVTIPALAQDKKPEEPGFDCLVQPKMVLKLGTPVPGLISELLVDRGSILKKGDVVARLESNVEAATV